ncbi:MAG: hypothetical protein [Microviridae sp.]|nr:MAG: hypothetical protein [Microviridae sp.]
MKTIDTQLENDAQGAETMRTAKRKVQISVEQLVELATDTELKKYFLEVIDQNPDIKAPMAIEIARALKRQYKIDALIHNEQK